MSRAKLILLLVLLVHAGSSIAQEKKFRFRRPLKGPVEAGWQAVPLPPDIFKNLNRELTDLRIYQFNGNDTVEVQYLTRILHDDVDEVAIELPVFNKSRKDGKLYLTVELKNDQKVNRLELDFEEDNFNGFVQLEGSADLKEWFKVDSLQRILSIKKDNIDFRSTTLNFPLSHYRYLRIRIDADKPLTFRSASFKKREIKSGVHTTPATRWKATTNRQAKNTVIEVTVDHLQPVSEVTITEEHTMDFYRPLTIEALRDSAKTPKGWTYYYDLLYSGYITSLDDHRVEFPYTFAGKLKITIQNADNSPLDFKSASVSGPQIELVGQFQPRDYFVYYGNEFIGAPSYDVVHFQNKIPAEMPSLTLGAEENLTHPILKGSPLFESKLWLWAIMGVVIAVLGYFTLKMMKAKE